MFGGIVRGGAQIGGAMMGGGLGAARTGLSRVGTSLAQGAAQTARCGGNIMKEAGKGAVRSMAEDDFATMSFRGGNLENTKIGGVSSLMSQTMQSTGMFGGLGETFKNTRSMPHHDFNMMNGYS